MLGHTYTVSVTANGTPQRAPSQRKTIRKPDLGNLVSLAKIYCKQVYHIRVVHRTTSLYRLSRWIKLPSSKDNKADQCNPNNPKYQGHEKGYQGTGTKADLDNHANQLNPNNERFQAPKK
ncbi:hypothetical protein RRG08_008415 [Elysia crispata]|uniref:Uncharacterized protein n=1 Tax=Elysia crispata TaxID=231223 RepID=A0AAE0ZTX2_9GAST|nr:hypothetical protein RRG08_008415 [Elysia crispata]